MEQFKEVCNVHWAEERGGGAVVCYCIKVWWFSDWSLSCHTTSEDKWEEFRESPSSKIPILKSKCHNIFWSCWSESDSVKLGTTTWALGITRHWRLRLCASPVWVAPASPVSPHPHSQLFRLETGAAQPNSSVEAVKLWSCYRQTTFINWWGVWWGFSQSICFSVEWDCIGDARYLEKYHLVVTFSSSSG